MTYSSQNSKQTSTKRDWKKLYQATEVWMSDLLFYKGDGRAFGEFEPNF